MTNQSRDETLNTLKLPEMIDLLITRIEDQDLAIQSLTRINNILSKCQVSENMAEEKYIKYIALIMIPVNFSLLFFDYTSKAKLLVKTYMVDYMKTLSTGNYDNNISLLQIVDDFIDEIFNRKQFDFMSNVIDQLISMIHKVNLEKFLDLVYNCLLFKLLNDDAEKKKNRKYKKLPSNPNHPYLQDPIEEKYKYTLILDLDETLSHTFHSSKADYYLVRPGVFYLLSKLHTSYEIVIFTAGAQRYADDILDIFDPDEIYIKHRLYRQHLDQDYHDKDLQTIGRDVSKVVVVDNSFANFQAYPDNGILVKSWKDDLEDSQLYGVTKVLLDLIDISIDDVRDAIHYIRKALESEQVAKMRNPYDEIDLKKWKDDQEKEKETAETKLVL